jgi:hypothetical protein
MGGQAGRLTGRRRTGRRVAGRRPRLLRCRPPCNLCTHPPTHCHPPPCPCPLCRYKDGELSVGENSCIDRCSSKYWQVRRRYGGGTVAL